MVALLNHSQGCAADVVDLAEAIFREQCSTSPFRDDAGSRNETTHAPPLRYISRL
jgi:hypothetical protein